MNILEYMVLKYDYQTEDGSWACKEFDYAPSYEEIVNYLLGYLSNEGSNTNLSGYRNAIEDMVQMFYYEIFGSLESDKRFIKFITESHTPEEFEDETL